MVNGWKPISLGDILRLERRPIKVEADKEYAEIGIYSYGRGIFHKHPRTGLEVGDKDLFQIKNGDFIFQITFAWEGAVGLASTTEDDMYGSVRFPTYRINEDICYPPFLLNYFKTAEGRRELIQISPGSAGRNRVLNTKRLTEILVPLPPLTEQRRIVTRIEALAERIAAAQSLRREASEESCALLESAIGKVFIKFNDINTQPLKALTSKIGSGSTPKGGRETYSSQGIPFIRSMNVRMRYFQYDDLAFIDETIHNSMSNTKVKPNDVLLNITGASIGRVACAPESLVEANVNQHVTIIRPISKLNHRFLMYWLSQPDIQKAINSEQKGATRQGFTKFQIENFHVPVLPLPEQLRLVTYLDSLQSQVSALRAAQTETERELAALLPSVLDRAFHGAL